MWDSSLKTELDSLATEESHGLGPDYARRICELDAPTVASPPVPGGGVDRSRTMQHLSEEKKRGHGARVVKSHWNLCLHMIWNNHFANMYT